MFALTVAVAFDSLMKFVLCFELKYVLSHVFSYGTPGVEFAVSHTGDIGVNRIFFLPTQVSHTVCDQQTNGCKICF